MADYYYRIGLSGTVAEFIAANKEAAARITTSDYYSRDYSWYSGGDDQQSLRQGAVDAFFAGRAEKLGAIMQNPDQFVIKTGYVNEADKRPAENVRASIISAIIKKSSDLSTDFRHLAIAVPQDDETTRREILLGAMLQLADRMEDVKALAQVDQKFFPRKGKIGAVQKILVAALDEVAPASGRDLAVTTLIYQAAEYERKEEKPLSDILTTALFHAATRPATETAVWDTVKAAAVAGTPAPEIQTALDQALYNVITKKESEAAAMALLNAHADANAAGSDGYKGRLLAEAVRNETSPAVIELLHAKGANFADALNIMKIKTGENWTSAEKISLRTQAKRITGKGIPGEDVQEVKADELAELRAQLKATKRELTEKTIESEKKTVELEKAAAKLKLAVKDIANAQEEINSLRSDLRYYKRQLGY